MFPCSASAPTASNLNYTNDDTVPNLVAVGVGDAGAICVFSYETTDVLVDITGFYGTGTYVPVPVDPGPPD